MSATRLLWQPVSTHDLMPSRREYLRAATAGDIACRKSAIEPRPQTSTTESIRFSAPIQRVVSCLSKLYDFPSRSHAFANVSVDDWTQILVSVSIPWTPDKAESSECKRRVHDGLASRLILAVVQAVPAYAVIIDGGEHFWIENFPKIMAKENVQYLSSADPWIGFERCNKPNVASKSVKFSDFLLVLPVAMAPAERAAISGEIEAVLVWHLANAIVDVQFKRPNGAAPLPVPGSPLGTGKHTLH